MISMGIGAAAVGGAAAYELVPKIPGALEQAGTNVEKQIEAAFQQGLAQGAAEVRKELVNSLDTVEGVSLTAAIDSAKILRLSYDAFVSPLVTLAANIAGDFLSIILDALITARTWLARINQDSDTLAALQTVLQSWVTKVKELPVELQSITDSDLDGAQSYLRGVQRVIAEQQAILNGAQPTASPTPKGTTT